MNDFVRIEAKFKSGAQLEFFKSMERCPEPGCHNVGFKAKGGLWNHKKKFHDRAAGSLPLSHPYLCDLCSTSCDTRGSLELHRERMHLGLVYSCGVCSFMSVQISKASAHANKSGHSMDRFDTGKDIFWVDE